MSFLKKVVLITGASSGVGANAARYLAKQSADLVLIGRNSANLEETSKDCHKISNLQPLSIVADITKDDDIERIIKETKERYGRLDVLVNNAGIGTPNHIYNLDMNIYDEVMNTNLRAVVNLTRVSVPMLIESKGNIINISSGLGVKPNPAMLAYSVSKSALNTFTQTISHGLAKKGVRVNGIVLGYAHTNIQNVVGNSKEQVSAAMKSIPLGIAVELDDLSKLIAYLASDDAKSITGTNVAIDGGYSST